MNIKKITALTLGLILSAGITVNAATSLPPTENNANEKPKIEQKEGFYKKKHNGGLYRTAKEIGITKKEMKEARENGTNFFELAKKKGYDKQKVKEMMIKNKSEHIDKAVEKGKFTKEQAEELKKNMREKIEKWDGTMKKCDPAKEKCKTE